MSIWYDSDAKRYRSSLLHKIFYKYGWKPIRKIMFLLPSEFAHHRGIESIYIVYKLDRIYQFLKLLVIIPILLFLLLLSHLPGFTLIPKD